MDFSLISHLPLKDQSDIAAAILSLERLRISGSPPTPDLTFRILSETGHLDLALDCYSSQLPSFKSHG